MRLSSKLAIAGFERVPIYCETTLDPEDGEGVGAARRWPGLVQN